MDEPLKPGDPIELKEAILIGEGVGAQGKRVPHKVIWKPGTVVAVHTHKISVLLYNNSARVDVPRQSGLWRRVVL